MDILPCDNESETRKGQWNHYSIRPVDGVSRIGRWFSDGLHFERMYEPTLLGITAVATEGVFAFSETGKAFGRER